MIDYYETKQHPITKKMVLDAYRKVRANKGSAGIDAQSLEQFEERLTDNLYKIWNRMTSGSYHPKAVREVQIPKKSGGYRGLGIPTVSDRVAQQVVKSYLEPKVEPSFHQGSYGYRPDKSAHDALAKTVRNCGYYSWVVDLDIRGFFDNIDHELLMKAVRVYTDEKWIIMYIERWLEVGVVREGKVHKREKGTPQGGVISPLLANIFLHFVFDKWMEKHHGNMPFERYCDDAIIHCTTWNQAVFIKNAVTRRMKECKLELNSEKTKIVYCKNSTHRESNPVPVSFTFLGHTFRPLGRPTKNGWKLTYFPCMSQDAKKSVREKVKSVVNRRFMGKLQDIAQRLNAMARGWINYYCVYSRWTVYGLWYWINLKLVRWVMRRKNMGRGRAHRRLRKIYNQNPNLFIHWTLARPY